METQNITDKNPSRAEIQKQIEELDRISRRDMAEWEYRRVRFSMNPPLVFDCRFNGAAQQIVQGRFQSFLNAFVRMAGELKETGTMSATVDDLCPEVISILQEAKEKKFDAIKLSARVHYYRQKLADKVSREINRDTGGHDVRRMGIGDQIVLFGIFQTLMKKYGGSNVTVVYDSLYPGTEALLKMSGLTHIDIAPDVPVSEFMDSASTYIDFRRHMLEHPLCDGVPPYYGEKTGDPSAQVLWGLGWEHSLPEHKIGHPILRVPLNAVDKAKRISQDIVDFITCQPLEATRLNKHTNANVYSHVLQTIGVHDIFFGGSASDIPKLKAFVRAMALPNPYRVRFIGESLATWLALIGLSRHLVTGNTSGMWLGFSTQVPMTILSKSDVSHGTMWNVKEKWFDPERFKSIRVLS